MFGISSRVADSTKRKNILGKPARQKQRHGMFSYHWVDFHGKCRQIDHTMDPIKSAYHAIVQLFPVNGVNVKRKSSLGICPKWWTRQTPWGLNQPLTRHVASPAAVFMVAFRCFSFMLVKHSSRIFLMIQRDFSPYGVVYCATTVQPLDIDWTTRLYFGHPPRISHSMRLVYSPHAPVAWFADVHLRLFVVTLVYSHVYLIPSISPWPFAGPAKVIEGYAEDSKFEHCRCWSGSWPWVLDALKQWVTRWSWSWRCEN